MAGDADSESDAEWLEALRKEVRSHVVAEALSELPDLGENDPVTWVTRERVDQSERVTAFVLAGRLLHRLSGPVDPPGGAPSEGVARCTYDVLFVTAESNYKVQVERGQEGAAEWTMRWWTFEFNPDETGLEIQYSIGTQSMQTPGPDPTEFARALVAAIVRERSETVQVR
jgi:hypothetical protein